MLPLPHSSLPPSSLLFPSFLSSLPSTHSSQPLFLLAMPCRSENCNGSAISLQFQWDLLPGTGNISQVAFFDLYEDVSILQWRLKFCSQAPASFSGPSLILRSQPRSQVPASFSVSPTLVIECLQYARPGKLHEQGIRCFWMQHCWRRYTTFFNLVDRTKLLSFLWPEMEAGVGHCTISRCARQATCNRG